MAFAPEDIRIGPCDVEFNGVDLGGTMEGVKFKFDPKYQDLKIDQLGDAPVDSVLISMATSCELTIAASANKDNWKIAIPYGKLNTSGSDTSFYVENKIGTQMSQFAAVLILHPSNLSSGDLSENIKAYKAIVKSAFEVEFGPTKQRGLKIMIDFLPDFSVSPARYFIFGDPSIGAIAASAGSAVAGTNTGNGTLTAITAGSKTVTETITATCIGINGSHHSAWKVEGAVTGAIGTVTLTGGAGGTGAFTSSYVNFTLTDGTTDFVVGDLFTIAMVGANYT